ncbi:MAG: beta-ketoacyl synthase N-terminal-like domain-containing protein [Niabella sp.]
MREVFVCSDNIISPLGFTGSDNFARLCNHESGIKLHNDVSKSPVPFYASLINEKDIYDALPDKYQQYSKFELLILLSVLDALSLTNIDLSNPKTGLIISSTKGNVNLLEKHALTDELKQEISLVSSAKKITECLGLNIKPIIVSQACISGLVALITAKRLLQAGVYDNIIVSGTDLITRFILSGFQSFQAVSDEPCKPFDADRKGINLGEAAATIVLSVNRPLGKDIVKLTGGAVSNDANHISGPSRTGEELHQAIEAAIAEAGIAKNNIGFISAHGTATVYNDDMESKAIKLSGLQQVPVNSLKGYYGHTLGAAGLLESVISIHSLRENKIIPTLGFNRPGTAEHIRVCRTLQHVPLQACLKTASGFGGCNAAVIWEKINE